MSWVRACVTSPMFSIMINGLLEGFFHGRKGLRQGDPLSPFLFVMVMEVLSRMLNNPPQSFQFHQFCEKVRLTHLTFADDLMIFCTADNYSMSFIKETIKRFGELSGLFANLDKTLFFLWGLIVRKLLGLLLTWVLPLVTSLFVILVFLSSLEDCGALIEIILFSVLPVVFGLGLLECYLLQVDFSLFAQSLGALRFIGLVRSCFL